MQTHHGTKSGNDEIKWEIGEILGLLEETNRTKEWLLNKIEKKGLKIHAKPSMNAFEILSLCPRSFVKEIHNFLKGDDIKSLEQDQVLTKLYHWFFIDIVAGSNPSIPTKAQVEKIKALNDLISKTRAFKERNTSSTIILPTGDGMAVGFSDSPENPFLLSMHLYKALSDYNQKRQGKERLLIRVGIDSGPVYFVKDLEGKDNVWGPGIMRTRHVMDMCGDMQIFASSRIVEELVGIDPTYKEMMHLVQEYTTKYGEKLQLYNIYGEGFGNKKAKQKPKLATSDLHRLVKTKSNFAFNSIDILLDVENLQTMQTRHTWVWDVTNVSKEPRSEIFYFIDGKTKKDFAEMKVSVTDEEGKNLEVSKPNVDRPYHKEFHVLLGEPVLPREKKRLVLKYDWEEPDRVFTYRFSTGTKKFNYSCSLPKEIDLKNKILKVDLDTGYKIHAMPPATINKDEERVVITWSKSNILSNDAYQFHW